MQLPGSANATGHFHFIERVKQMTPSGQFIVIRLKGDKPGAMLPGDFYDSLCDDIEASFDVITTVVQANELGLPAYAKHELEEA
jgi:hypothetical protein